MGSHRQKRARKQTFSYCQQLIEATERSENAQKSECTSIPEASSCKLLALPLELRQQILYHVLDDGELVRVPLQQTARELSHVSKTFKADMLWVLDRGEERKRELSAVQTGAFNTYIADLMGPLMSASRSYTRINELPGVSQKKQYSSRKYDKQRAEQKQQQMLHSSTTRPRYPGSFSERYSDKRWTDPSQTERDDAKLWRQKRETKVASVAEKRKVERQELRESRRKNKELQRLQQRNRAEWRYTNSGAEASGDQRS